MSVTHKTFIKKTRRGKILKVVREHYLREDLGCGSSACQTCDNDSASVLLDQNPTSKTNAFKQPHYVVLDTNIVLEQIDVLEAEGLQNVIVLHTVLEEVRHRSSPVFKRLKDLIGNSERKFYVFVNEHHKETYVDRQPGETANDRNDRAIRMATHWYRNHLSNANIDVVMISDDKENRSLAEKLGLNTCTIAKYVKGLTEFPMLMDKLSFKDLGTEEIATGKFLFSEHLSKVEINHGIKSKKLVQGVFYVNRTNYLEGTVNSEAYGKPILVQGIDNQNRAVDGDTVAVEVFAKEEWTSPCELILEDEGYDPGDSLDKDKKLLEKAVKSADIQPTGRVRGIVKRKWRQYCGILQSNPVEGSTRHLFVPAEKKISKVRIETRQVHILKGQRIIVAIDSWPRSSRYPLGHFVRALGPIGDKATENQVLLLEHDIPHSSFSEAVLDCLPSLPWEITPEDEAKRVDCRHLDICSVDPPGCTDIDDALHCRRLENGNFEVGVHIADVSHFIRPNTAIDKEAAKRSTTVYLTDRRIDMVPELLSSNLCSLRGGVERFAFSCVWEMTEEANIVSTVFHKSIIKSRSAMTYEQAQNKIDDPNDNGPLAASLRNLLSLSKILKRRRIEKGALVLASSEIRFNVDSETADPIDVETKQIRETNSMVEEFMLAANISAAERIYSDFPECAMLRRHPAPPPSNFDPLVKAGNQQGFEIKVETGKQLADSLDQAVDKVNPFFNTMLRMIATRCMMQAVYFASGTIDRSLFVHYGLACPIYTHFTSPIRRYADVIVHRLLAATIGADSTYPELLDKKQTQRIANNINYRHRMAQYASRASVNLHTHIFFRNKLHDEEGYILFVRQNAIQVLIPKYGLEGTLYLRPDDKKTQAVDFTFNEDIPSQKSGDVELTLFQRVTVQLTLDQSNIQHEKLVLRLVNPKIPGFSVPPASAETPMETSGSPEGRKRPLETTNGKSTKKKKTKR